MKEFGDRVRVAAQEVPESDPNKDFVTWIAEMVAGRAMIVDEESDKMEDILLIGRRVNDYVSTFSGDSLIEDVLPLGDDYEQDDDWVNVLSGLHLRQRSLIKLSFNALIRFHRTQKRDRGVSPIETIHDVSMFDFKENKVKSIGPKSRYFISEAFRIREIEDPAIRASHV